MQRDVDVVFHNLGLESKSPIRDYNGGVQDAPFPVQDAPYTAQDAFTYDFDDASMTHSITADEGTCVIGGTTSTSRLKRSQIQTISIVLTKLNKKQPQ